MNSKRGGAFLAFIFGLAIGGAVGAALMHKYLSEQTARTDRAAQIARDERALNGGRAPVERPGGSTSEPSEDYLQRKLREWNLTSDDLKRELGQAGDVIKREGKKLGSRLSDATSDLRVVAEIKAKYARDKQLSGWDIAVGSKDGHVTLGGTVTSHEQIGRAVAMALDTDGVVDVVSSLRVQAK